MKQSTPRTFTGLARSGHKRTAQNSGILSNSGAGQKSDRLPASGPPMGRTSKADTGNLAYATQRGKMKSMPKKGAKGGDAGAQRVAQYAIRHGEKS